ncbi:MAG: lipopolysaccharide kinase InaA family protein [Thiopseudomonas sp.]
MLVFLRKILLRKYFPVSYIRSYKTSKGLAFVADNSFCYKHVINKKTGSISEGVVILNEEKSFVKVNTVSGLRRFVKYLFFKPKRMSLIHEFANLLELEHTGLAPKPLHFELVFGFLKVKEVLIIRLYEDALTVDDYLRLNSEKTQAVLKKTLNLFLKSWHKGFTHLDPHLRNILIYDGELFFVDFEGCKIKTEDAELHFGFLFGRFYKYWFSAYMDEPEYDCHVFTFLEGSGLDLQDERFFVFYTDFKHLRFSRVATNKLFNI